MVAMKMTVQKKKKLNQFDQVMRATKLEYQNLAAKKRQRVEELKNSKKDQEIKMERDENRKKTKTLKKKDGKENKKKKLNNWTQKWMKSTMKSTKNMNLNVILKVIISVLTMIAIVMTKNISTEKRTLSATKIFYHVRKLEKT